jgi:hypothetical protein
MIRTPSSIEAAQPECEEALRDAITDLVSEAMEAGWSRELVISAIEQIIKDDKIAHSS